MVGPTAATAGMTLDVVLLTSKVAGDFMQELTFGLREKGIASEVVAGAELDTELLIDAMRRYRRGALYVMCRDDELDEDAAERLRKNLLHSRKVDEQHVVSIALRNKSLAGHANALAVKARLLGQRQRPDATRGAGMELGSMATMPRIRRVGEGVDDDARTTVARNPLGDEDIATRVAPLPTARPATDYTPRAPPPPSTGTVSSKVSVGPAKMPPMTKAAAPKPAAAVKKEDPATKISRPAQPLLTPAGKPVTPAPAQAPTATAAAPESLSPAPALAPEPVVATAPAQPPPAIAPSPSPLVSPSDAADFDAIEDIEPNAGTNKTALLAVAAALLAVGVGVAVSLTLTGGEEQVAVVETKVGDKTPEEVIAEAQAKLAEEKAIEAAAQAEAEAAAAAAKTKADAQYAKEREEAAKTGRPEAPAATDADSETQEEAGEEEPELENEDEGPADARVPATADEKAAISAALQDKSLRSLDEVIVDPERSRQGTYPEALAYCEGRVSHGVQGWRVPEIGEISALVAARMVVKDHYWSTTAGDTSGNRQLVYDSRHGKIKSMSPKWKGGRVVCVRKREL